MVACSSAVVDGYGRVLGLLMKATSRDFLMTQVQIRHPERAQQDGVMREAGFFIQDSWRMKPNFTVNFGLRYELQIPFYPLNNSYSTATLEVVGRICIAQDGQSRITANSLRIR
jgi:hypothetical protein